LVSMTIRRIIIAIRAAMPLVKARQGASQINYNRHGEPRTAKPLVSRQDAKNAKNRVRSRKFHRGDRNPIHSPFLPFYRGWLALKAQRFTFYRSSRFLAFLAAWRERGSRLFVSIRVYSWESAD